MYKHVNRGDWTMPDSTVLVVSKSWWLYTLYMNSCTCMYVRTYMYIVCVVYMIIYNQELNWGRGGKSKSV